VAAGNRLIVNADDFGLSPGVNAGIILAYRRGLLTSASLMANGPAFRQAAVLAAESPGLGVGVHLNLARGRPLSPPGEIPDLVDGDGRLRGFRLRRHPRPFLEQAEREYRRQFEAVIAAGIRPTHIDFEKHHAWRAPLYGLACRLAREYGVAAARNLREAVVWSFQSLGWPGWRRLLMAAGLRAGTGLFGGGRAGLAVPDRLLGQWRIGAMDEAAWLRLLRRVPPGVSEVMTHPGLPEAPPEDIGPSWLGREREGELAALLSEKVRRAAAAAGVRLINYRNLAAGT
jgi:predicted glycoside hydrolase/deacetylase ChbG (UPF0249 family)